MADVGRGVSAGLHMGWDHSFGPMPVTLLARLRKHTRADLGLRADLRLSVGLFKGGRFGAGAFVQGTWADTRSTQALYGTTAQSSPSTGLPPFTAQGGWLHTSAGMLWSFDLSPSWVLVGSVEARRLKFNALVMKDRIQTTEEFIERAASQSSLSGQADLIRCGGGPATTSNKWLRDELARLRARR